MLYIQVTQNMEQKNSELSAQFINKLYLNCRYYLWVIYRGALPLTITAPREMRKDYTSRLHNDKYN